MGYKWSSMKYETENPRSAMKSIFNDTYMGSCCIHILNIWNNKDTLYIQSMYLKAKQNKLKVTCSNPLWIYLNIIAKIPSDSSSSAQLIFASIPGVSKLSSKIFSHSQFICDYNHWQIGFVLAFNRTEFDQRISFNYAALSRLRTMESGTQTAGWGNF